MNAKTLLVLTVAAVGLAAVAVMTKGDGSNAAPSTEKGALFEGLVDRVNDVARIEIDDGSTTFAIERKDDAWGLADKGGYPVRFEDVKQTIVGVANLDILAQMTSKPERYAKLGVEDPGTSEESASKLVTLKDDGGAVMASVIVGNTKYGGKQSVYVRRAGEPESWRCSGKLTVNADPKGWLDKQVVTLDRERVQGVQITHPDGEVLSVGRENADTNDYTVEGMPPGRDLTSPSAPTPVATALTSVTLDDVRPIDEIDFEAEPGATLVCRTFDGMVVTARLAKQDEVTWARFHVAYEAPPEPDTPEAVEGQGEGEDTAPIEPAGTPTPAEVEAEVAELAGRFEGWAFALPTWKVGYFEKRLDDLLAPLEEPSETEETSEPIALTPPVLETGESLESEEEAAVPEDPVEPETGDEGSGAGSGEAVSEDTATDDGSD